MNTLRAQSSRPFGALLLAASLLAAALPARAETFVYVSNADSQEVSVLALDRQAGRLSPVDTVAVGGTVMPMVVSPDKRFLYAALRSQPYRVVSFALDATNGRLKKLGEAPLADSMANIDLDATGRWLFAASYPGHKLTVNSIDASGLVGAIQQLVPTAPNAHALHADASNRFVLATSLGADHLSVWRFDVAKGQLTPHDPPIAQAAPKSGARHFVWDKAQRHLYLLNELDASLYVYDWDAVQGTLREVQRTSTLPPGFSGKPWAADMHLGPDGKTLYASERTSSTIAAFRVDAETGRLGAPVHAATEMTPRGFAIDPSGRFLIAAGQESHSVSVHAIDPRSGALGAPSRLAVGKNPNWIEIVDLP